MRPARQSALACSMRSLDEETKFHSMKRSPTGSPPSSMTMGVGQAGDQHRRAGGEDHHLAGDEGAAVDLHRSGRHEGGALGIFGRDLGSRAGLQPPVDVEHRRMGLHRRLGAEGLAGDQPRPQAVGLVGRQVVGPVMGEGRIGLLLLAGAGRPRPGCRAWARRVARRSSKRSEWVMPRPAVIQLTSPGRIACSGAHAVAVGHLAFEQVGDGRKADVRVRAHVDAAREARLELRRAHVVEEDERPDHPVRGEGQDAADLEAAEVAPPLVDDEFDHGQQAPGGSPICALT